MKRFFWIIAIIASSSVAFAQMQVEKLELQPPRGEIPPSFWELHTWQVVFGAIGFLMFAGGGVVWFRRPKLVVAEPPVVIARRALETLRGRPGSDALADTVSRILRRYVRNVFKFPPEEMTTAELCQALKSHPQISPELAVLIGNFLRRCDAWKFDPHSPPPQSSIVQDALNLVEQVETYHARASAPQAMA